MSLVRRMASPSIVLALSATVHASVHYELDSTPGAQFENPRIQAHVISSDQSSTVLEIVIPDEMAGPRPDEFGIGLVAVGPHGRIEASVDALEASCAGHPAEALPPGSSEGPTDLITIGEPAIWRELRVVRVGIRPKWRSGPKEWGATRMVVSVANAGGVGEAELDHPPRPVSPHWDRLYRAHVLNYEAFQPPRLTVGTGPRYLVVSRSRFATQTQAFAEWKTRQGYGVEVVTLEDLGYTNPLDRDAINATKRCIMEAYTSWTDPVEFVLLTGDMYDAIPSGSIYSKQFTDIMGFYPLQRYYDQWYALVDGPDLLPDIMVGRMPDTNLARLEYLFSKSIGYEMDPLIQGAWQRNAIMTAMHSNPQHATILTKQEISDTLTAWGMNVHERYNAQAVPGNLIPLINQGVTFYNYRGEWCAEYDWGGTFGPWDVAYINNTRKLGVWTILSCSSADIVYGYPTVAELMLRVGYENPASPRGAVALIGSQGYTHANFNNPLDTGFYEAFTHEGASLLGEAFVASKAYLASVTAPTDSQAVTLREYTILGDPSLQVWTDVPAALAVSTSPPAVPEGFTTNVSIQAADSMTGAPVPDALVCLLRQDDVYVYGYTDENGNVALPVTPESSGSSGLTIGVTVTGCNRMPWFAALETLTQRPASPENVSAEYDDGTWTIRWSPVLADERGLPADVDRYEIEMTKDGDPNAGGVESLHVVSGTSATLFPAPRNASARVLAISRDGLRSRPSSGVGILHREILTGGGGR